MGKCEHADEEANVRQLYRERLDGGDDIPYYECKVCDAKWV